MAKFMYEDHHDVGYIQERMFRLILREFIGSELSEHEIITLTRNFRSPDMRHARLPEVMVFALLQNELRRLQFSSFDEILSTLNMKDTKGSGKLSKSVVRHTLVGSLAASSKSNLRTHAIRDLVDKALVT